MRHRHLVADALERQRVLPLGSAPSAQSFRGRDAQCDGESRTGRGARFQLVASDATGALLVSASPAPGRDGRRIGWDGTGPIPVHAGDLHVCRAALWSRFTSLRWRPFSNLNAP
jgi:hypothetical protein